MTILDLFISRWKNWPLLKGWGRRWQRKHRWKSEFAFFQSSSRLLQVTNFFKCKANHPKVEFLRTIAKRKFRRRLRTSSVQREIRHFRVVTCIDGKEMYKKAWCTCEIVVLLIKPIAFVEFPSPSSDLKVPIGIGQLGTRFSGRCHCREVYTRVNIWTVRRGKKVAVVERWPSVEVRQPKYCYEKTIHVVLNQLCSSLWTSLFRQYMHVCVWVCVCVCVCVVSDRNNYR